METSKLLAQLNAFLEQLYLEETYEPEEGRWTFTNGGDCCVCTDAAIRIVEKLGGVVVGYQCASNPSALINMKYCDGHDFAIVGKRYLVDYWAHRVCRILPDPIVDLQSAKGLTDALHYYGDPKRWAAVRWKPEYLTSHV